MNWVSCCNPPKKIPDPDLENPQLWQCPICGQWWLIRTYNWVPERISRIGVVLFYFSKWRHYRKAHKGDNNERDRIG